MLVFIENYIYLEITSSTWFYGRKTKTLWCVAQEVKFSFGHINDIGFAVKNEPGFSPPP